MLDDLSDFKEEFPTRKNKDVSDWDLLLNNWLRLLELTIASIEKVPSDTESEFLSIGMQMMNYHEMTARISSVSFQAADILVGKEILMPIEGLQGLLDKLNAHLKTSEAVMENRINHFLHVIELINESNMLLDEFNMVSKSFKPNISDSIKNLSQTIIDRSETTKANLEEILRVIKQSLPEVISAKKEQRDNIRHIQKQISKSFVSLRERCTSASSALARLSACSDHISQNIEKVVLAVQFHDITRQQISGISDAIKTLCSKIKDGLENNVGSPASVGKDTVRLVAEAAKLCEHVSSDLSTVRDTMKEAVSSISANLNNISTQVTNMSEQARTITASSTISRHSFFGEIGNSLDTLSSSLHGILKTDIEFSDNSAIIERLIEKISIEVTGLEQISADVNRFALNTGGKSSHFAAVTAETLRAIKNNVKTLSAKLDREAEKTRDKAGRIEQEMQSLVDIFKNLDERATGLHQALDADVMSLSENIRETLYGMAAHRNITMTIKGAIKELKSMAIEGKRAVHGTHYGDIRLDDIIIAYQVKIGRAGHSIYGNADILDKGACRNHYDSEPNIDNAFNGLGNNVELF